MFSDKTNVNILTSLLVAHGIRHAVVCPGSRNAPIVHNLNECPDIACHPVTDERSAGFYALGIAQKTGQPVVVCVTSGTALLNVAPAVAEAYYQHRPLVVVSADRPQAWIDQQDGQTLPQPDALGRFVCKAVTLPEPTDEVTRWHCNRLVNEALMKKHGPVHINVPITEPLFNFTVAELPQERRIEWQPADLSSIMLNHIAHMFMQAERPMLISGHPQSSMINGQPSFYDFPSSLLQALDERYIPDFVVYTGGPIVSKQLKHFLRRAKQTWIVNPTGEVYDTFMNLTNVIQGDGEVVADYLRFMLEQQGHPFVQRWDDLLLRIRQQAESYEPPFSQMAAVKYFEQRVGKAYRHYANSMSIRLASIFARGPVYCNRGVNGIEGSLSTAAGFSLVADAPVYCVIGDLSFFYDQNALWNQEIDGRLRILLLNNGKGGIFNMLKGLEQSPARDRLIAAQHTTVAAGACMQHDVYYQQVCNEADMQRAIDLMTAADMSRPMLIEVLTNPDIDEETVRRLKIEN
jgi:2-succinyl-5-enolpyruvyl-6-hydroxy-3-cyclohexene-1-carboxylate synthase